MAMEDIKAPETVYRWLRDTMMDAFVSVDMSGRINEFNEAYRKMLGYEPEELPRLTYVDLTPERWRAFEANLVETQIIPKGCSEVYEKEYRRKDGTIIPVELRTVLLRDAAGKPAGMWAIVRDISERKRMEQTLQERVDEAQRQSEEQFRAVVEFLPIGVTVVCDYTIVYINRHAVRIHRAERPGDLIGRDVLGMVPANRRKDVLADMDKLLRGPDAVQPHEGAILSMDGQRVEVEIGASVFRYGGRPAILYVLRDITEQKRLEVELREGKQHFEALAERNRRLVRELDHRVRNNLTGLLGLVSMTRARAASVDDFAAAIESRLTAMVHIHRLLAEAQWGDVDVQHMVISTQAAMHSLALYANDVKVSGPRVTLPADMVMPLTMILVEWFTNSSKYGAHAVPQGKLEITWQIGGDPGQGVFRLTWIERNGPPVKQNIVPSLGTELVQSFATRELRGRCRMSYPEQGAEYYLEFPCNGCGDRPPDLAQ